MSSRRYNIGKCDETIESDKSTLEHTTTMLQNRFSVCWHKNIAIRQLSQFRWTFYTLNLPPSTRDKSGGSTIFEIRAGEAIKPMKLSRTAFSSVFSNDVFTIRWVPVLVVLSQWLFALTTAIMKNRVFFYNNYLILTELSNFNLHNHSWKAVGCFLVKKGRSIASEQRL